MNDYYNKLSLNIWDEYVMKGRCTGNHIYVENFSRCSIVPLVRYPLGFVCFCRQSVPQIGAFEKLTFGFNIILYDIYVCSDGSINNLKYF